MLEANMNKMKGASDKPTSVKSNPLKDAELNEQFELELCWCIQQLELALNDGKLNKRAAEDIARNIKILKSKSTPLIRKRQIMKAVLGDYRQKMREDEKKMSLSAKQIKFTTTPSSRDKSSKKIKSCFVKKCSIVSTDNNFRFNFKVDNSKDEGNEILEAVSENSKTFPLNMTNGNNFKFNFIIDNDVNDEINFNTMKI